jgi:hypothetical protein
MGFALVPDQVLGISTYTPEEVSNHSLAADPYIVIDRDVSLVTIYPSAPRWG